MSNMGHVGNWGMNMGKGGVGGVNTGPNSGPNAAIASVNQMPSHYANPCFPGPAQIAPATKGANIAGVGVSPCWNMAGIVLVLYILLVIITRCSFI